MTKSFSLYKKKKKQFFFFIIFVETWNGSLIP